MRHATSGRASRACALPAAARTGPTAAGARAPRTRCCARACVQHEKTHTLRFPGRTMQSDAGPLGACASTLQPRIRAHHVQRLALHAAGANGTFLDRCDQGTSDLLTARPPTTATRAPLAPAQNWSSCLPLRRALTHTVYSACSSHRTMSILTGSSRCSRRRSPLPTLATRRPTMGHRRLVSTRAIRCRIGRWACHVSLMRAHCSTSSSFSCFTKHMRGSSSRPAI